MLSLLAASMLLAAPATPAQDEAPPIPADTEIQTLPSGLKYSVLKPGAGPSPAQGTLVTVHYTGWLPDGTVFDSSVQRGEPFQFPLGVGRVIKAWDEGVALMRKGARYKLTIPPELGYGEQGAPPTIPPSSWLIFEVELLDFPILPEFHPANPEAQKRLESGIVYEVLTPGEGEPFGAGKIFDLRFALWNTSGKLLDCTERSKQNLKGLIGAAQIPFLDQAVPLMRKGMRLRLEVPPELAFGERAMGPDLPANSTTVWELELVGIADPLPLPEFTLGDPAKQLKTGSGLGYEMLKAGEGESPKMGQNVTVHYAGWLTDGTLFDSSFQRAEPATFRLGGVIQGWNEGLQLMKPGAVYRFTIPADLAYGVRGSPPRIPPSATLVFHIELLEVGR